MKTVTDKECTKEGLPCDEDYNTSLHAYALCIYPSSLRQLWCY
jgi:hypothetical protein